MSIIIHGDEVDIGLPSISWADHELSFEVGTCGVKSRAQSADLGVIHYTAGEGSAPQVYRVLRDRGYSIHFVIDRDGVVYQFVDPANYSCCHAGRRANDRSVGIEVVSYGHARGKPPLDKERPTYTGTVHGWTTTIADFYDCQYDALDALCRAVSDRLPIDLCVPNYPDQRIPERLLAAYYGWCGHYHVESSTSMSLCSHR